MALDGSIIDEEWGKEWDAARKVAQSILDQYQNKPNSTPLDVLIADALMNAYVSGWNSTIDSDYVATIRNENAELQKQLAYIQGLYEQAMKTSRRNRGYGETRDFVGID